MKHWILGIVFVLFSCGNQSENPENSNAVSLIVLGTVQDGGSPHIGCQRDCCAKLFLNPDPTRKVVSLGIVDHENGKSFLFEATPDMPSQLKALKAFSGLEKETPDGIFLTHAHIGHYSGLMFLGREALGGNAVPVFAMPKMEEFLTTNGPWSQLVDLENMRLHGIKDTQRLELTSNIDVVPFVVPHRDEFSETVGFKIIGPTKTVLFIPDIDKWSKWSKNIIQEIRAVDYAFLDASFFDATEINNRDISEIPHPFVIESMALFDSIPVAEKQKVHFIHLNHTNPLLLSDSEAYQSVTKKGYKVAHFHQKIAL